MVSAQCLLPELRHHLESRVLSPPPGQGHPRPSEVVSGTLVPGELALVLGRPRWRWGLEEASQDEAPGT